MADATLPCLTIHGKGNKQRIVARSDIMVKRLRKHLRARQKALARCDGHVALFLPSRYGGRLSNRRADDILKGYGEQASIEGVRVSTHIQVHLHDDGPAGGNESGVPAVMPGSLDPRHDPALCRHQIHRCI